MWNYIKRRLYYALPIFIGVNALTFSLFFSINSIDDVARFHLGEKYVTQEAIENWKVQHGYADPLFWNGNAEGVGHVTQTLFYRFNIRLLAFDFGQSDQGDNIAQTLKIKMGPSLSIAVPTFILGLWVNITVALGFMFFKGTRIEKYGLQFMIVLLSISSLYYVIGGQYLFAKLWKWGPISGYASGDWRFVMIPILIAVVSGLGPGVRWYHRLFMDEWSRDYVRTAKALGLSPWRILSTQVLPNALLPILTGVVVVIPSLFLGSLLLESFFGIPGLGSYTLDAIASQDFAIIRAMVFLGTLLYWLGLLLTDLSYVWCDPRVRYS